VYTVNTDYRLRKTENLLNDKTTLPNVGFAHMPNFFLSNREVIGIDLEMAEKPDHYTEIFTGTLQQFGELNRDSVDAISAGEILEHIENPGSFLRECHNFLSSGGKLFLSAPNSNSPFERLLTLELFRKYFYTQDHFFYVPQRWLTRVSEYAEFSNLHVEFGGAQLSFLRLVAFPRLRCHQTIAVAYKK
jgi:SAM-dependent methyltransferase